MFWSDEEFEVIDGDDSASNSGSCSRDSRLIHSSS
jgi:hypothetical protein